MVFGTFSLELANKIRKGRAVGNLYVVTRRPLNKTGIVASLESWEEAEAWIEAAQKSAYEETGLIFPSLEGK